MMNSLREVGEIFSDQTLLTSQSIDIRVHFPKTRRVNKQKIQIQIKPTQKWLWGLAKIIETTRF